ncbi:hypothetical protein, partial [Acinetobacter pecorum]
IDLNIGCLIIISTLFVYFLSLYRNFLIFKMKVEAKFCVLPCEVSVLAMPCAAILIKDYTKL